MGVYWIHPDVCPSVCPSVRPSVDKVSGTFWKKLLAQFISYLAFTLMRRVSWPLFIFMFLASFLALWWPNIWLKMGFLELFEKNYWPNSFHTWHLPLWGESLDPYTFSCSKPLFQPSGGQIFGRKWGFRNFLKKLFAQFISYLAFTLMVWVSWPLYIFVFLAYIFGTLVAKYLAENGFSGTFWEKI